jgi:peptidoglycan hydrolase-like protein with peptidoglycan-binding domain
LNQGLWSAGSVLGLLGLDNETMSELAAKASDLNSANLSSKKLLRSLGVSLLACAATVGPMRAQPQSQPTSKTKPGKGAHRKSKRSRVASWRRGQQKADPQRAREIQEALVREHYLKGEPTGRWDEATQKAMQRYQAANGWQTKTVPDSRALIKLGLGPSHDHLLNPESAMTTALPEQSASTSATPPADSSHSPNQK